MGLIDHDRAGRGERWRPWAALLLPAAAWLLFEYGAGSVLGVDCRAVGQWAGVSWGLASLVCCVVASWLAWPMAARAAGDDPPARAWLARLALLGAGLFGLAISLQTLATAIVPSCAR
jgi:hypothetical protein